MSDIKPTNPKDFIGSTKMPYHLWPNTATMLGTLALLDGAAKYGRSNWRHAGVRASIYYDAARRHLDAWFEGEDKTTDSGVDHLGHALACIAIIIDAQAAGKLNDDRMIAGGYHKLLAELTPMVAALKEQHADKSPHHFTIQDGVVLRRLKEIEHLCGKPVSVDGSLAKARPCKLAYSHSGACA